MIYIAEPPRRLDPSAPRAHDVVKEAAKKGFTVTFHPERDGYFFRHRLGKVRFFLPELHLLDYRDLEVWD
jgi:hypothetical protein